MYTDHAEYYRNQSQVRARGGYGHYDRPRPEGAVKLHSGLRRVLTERLDYVRGLESPSDFPNIVRGLVRDGYSDAEIAKIAGGNGMRLLKEVL